MKKRLRMIFFLILFFTSLAHLYFYRIDLDDQLWSYMRNPSLETTDLSEESPSPLMAPFYVEESNLEEKKQQLLSMSKKFKGLMLVINEGPRSFITGKQEIFYSSQNPAFLEKYYPSSYKKVDSPEKKLFLDTSYSLPGMELDLQPLEKLSLAGPYSVRFLGSDVKEIKQDLEKLQLTPIKLPQRTFKIDNPFLYTLAYVLQGLAFLGICFYYALQTKRELEIRKTLGHGAFHIFLRQYSPLFFAGVLGIALPVMIMLLLTNSLSPLYTNYLSYLVVYAKLHLFVIFLSFLLLLLWISFHRETTALSRINPWVLALAEVVKVGITLLTLSFLLLNSQWSLRFTSLKDAYRLDPSLDEQFLVEDPDKVDYQKTLLRVGRYSAEEKEKQKPPVIITNAYTVGLMGITDTGGTALSENNLNQDQHYVLLPPERDKKDLLEEFLQGKELFKWIRVPDTKEWLSLPSIHGTIKKPLVMVFPQGSPFMSSFSTATIFQEHMPREYVDQWRSLKEYYESSDRTRRIFLQKGYFQFFLALLAWCSFLFFSLELYLGSIQKKLALELTLGYEFFQRHKGLLLFKGVYWSLWILAMALSGNIAKKLLMLSFPKELTGTTNFATLSTTRFLLFFVLFFLLDVAITFFYLKKKEKKTLEALENQA